MANRKTPAAQPRIGLGWSVLGALMLGAAIATPVVLVKLAPVRDLTATVAVPDTDAKPVDGVAIALLTDPAATSDVTLAPPEVETLAPPVVEVPRHDPTPAGQLVAGVSTPDPVAVPQDTALAEPSVPANPETLPSAQPAEPAPKQTTLLGDPAQPQSPAVLPSRSGSKSAALGTPGDLGPGDLSPNEPNRVQAEMASPQPAAPEGLTVSLTEAAMELSSTERRRIQIGLKAMGHDPKGADGVFGPLTRAAIMSWQRARGGQDHGFIGPEDRDQLLSVGAKVVARLAARKTPPKPVLPQSMPYATTPPERRVPQCARDTRGVIIDNQSFQCDLSVLREGISNLFGGRG